MQNVSAETETKRLDAKAWFRRELGDGPIALRPGPGEPRRAPGWFESSWELQRGLEVREGLPDDVDLAHCFGDAGLP